MIYYQRMKKLIISVLVFSFLSIAPQAQGMDGCGVGLSIADEIYDETTNEIETVCEETKWEVATKNDGFTNYFSIVMYPDGDDENASAEDDSYLQIFCQKKKISVYVWVEYADSYGFSGSGQYRFDSGKSTTFKYTLQKDFDGIVLNETKSFMASLVKAKNYVSFKIPTVDGYELGVYPKADFLDYRKTFAAKGCKF